MNGYNVGDKVMLPNFEEGVIESIEKGLTHYPFKVRITRAVFSTVDEIQEFGSGTLDLFNW